LFLLMTPGHLPPSGPAGWAGSVCPVQRDRLSGAAVTERHFFPLKTQYMQGKYSDYRYVPPVTKQWVRVH